MPEDFSSALLTFGLAFVPALFGIICHEVAHGYTAFRMGDPTAKSLGRLTLNPIKHLDPVGFGVFAFTALFSPFIIGWAKPVPVQPRYFRNPSGGMMLVALAGPMTNFLVALFFALIVKLIINLSHSGIGDDSTLLALLFESARFGIYINCALACFNLLPIPPLDGSHILAGLLPRAAAGHYVAISRYGMIIVLVLVASGFFGKVMMPLISVSSDIILALVGL